MKKLYTIGRDAQSDIVINDNSDVVSRLHATIRFDGTKMFLIDQSLNGTYVNGMRMSANEEIPVTRKDTISFANVAELDWSLLPNPAKDRMKIAVMTVVAVVVVAGIIMAIYYFRQPEPLVITPPEPTVLTDTTAQKPVAVDTKDSVMVKPADTKDSAKKGKNNKKDEAQEVTEENPQEQEPTEIPLY